MPVEFPQRGEIYIADLNPVLGHEQGGRRPVLIIQNDVGNRFSPTTIIAPLTSSISPRAYPTEVRVKAGVDGLTKDSAIMLNQIKAIDKSRLDSLIGRLDDPHMRRVDEAIRASLGLTPL